MIAFFNENENAIVFNNTVWHLILSQKPNSEEEICISFVLSNSTLRWNYHEKENKTNYAYVWNSLLETH